jgi:hypothetical protein
MAGRNMPLVDILLTATARREIAKRERSISEIGKRRKESVHRSTISSL